MIFSIKFILISYKIIMNIKNITVYCGANLGKNEIYKKETILLAEWIVKNNFTLIYGGGKVGLMGILADHILANQGKVIGVIPSFLVDRELAHSKLSELHIVENMHERKKKMIELGNCYLALPGGPGTLEEITEAFSLARLGEHNNPCILFNTNQYYNYFESFITKMTEEEFLTSKDREKFFISNNITDIENFITNYEPIETRKYK